MHLSDLNAAASPACRQFAVVAALNMMVVGRSGVGERRFAGGSTPSAAGAQRVDHLALYVVGGFGDRSVAFESDR
jgi:hypothetical protein